MTYREFLSSHVASATLKQRRFADFLKENGDPDWAVDMETGRASFGKVGAFPFQIIGTESEIDGTWMWSWANAQSELNPQLLGVANQLRALGEREGVAAFSEPTLPLRANLGHELSLVAVGACGADAYYRGPYQGGALYFTLIELPLASRAPLSSGAEIGLLAQVISNYDVDGETMVRSFFADQNYPMEQTETALTATRPNGEQIVVTFDEQRRISNLETTMKAHDAADDAPKNKPWWRFGF